MNGSVRMGIDMLLGLGLNAWFVGVLCLFRGHTSWMGMAGIIPYTQYELRSCGMFRLNV